MVYHTRPTYGYRVKEDNDLRTDRHDNHERDEDFGDKVQDTAQDVKEGAKDAWNDVKDSVQDMTNN